MRPNPRRTLSRSLSIAPSLSCALAIALILPLLPNQVNAVAFCALRDPTQQIGELYPGFTNFRSLVDRIDQGVKTQVGAQLPFAIHDRELGQHTLYIVLQDTEPMGLIHVRSESSLWGLIEIVWSLDMNMRVRDFRFQRCRDAGCQAVTDESFKTVLRGKSPGELQAMLEQADGANLPVGDRHKPLALAIVRSALKTVMVTELVWGEKVKGIG